MYTPHGKRRLQNTVSQYQSVSISQLVETVSTSQINTVSQLVKTVSPVNLLKQEEHHDYVLLFDS
jgi:hypothetical protein